MVCDAFRPYLVLLWASAWLLLLAEDEGYWMFRIRGCIAHLLPSFPGGGGGVSWGTAQLRARSGRVSEARLTPPPLPLSVSILKSNAPTEAWDGVLHPCEGWEIAHSPALAFTALPGPTARPTSRRREYTEVGTYYY